MGLRRLAGLAVPTLALAGCLASAPARALPVTVYDHVDLGAAFAASGARNDAASADATAIVDVALEPAPKQADLSVVALEVSFHRWDENLIGMVNGVVAPVDPDR
jgi:hypothetical protein